MFNPEELPELRRAIQERAKQDLKLIEQLRAEVQVLRSNVRAIKSRATTSISLVASDGGNNKLQFDPFYFQLVRVVDSNGKQLCLDTISPTTDTDELSERQFYPNKTARTALGQLMLDLDCKTLSELSPMIPSPDQIKEGKVSSAWVLVYRDLCEWAVLYHKICYTQFANNTLLVRDGLLRSKIFAGLYFRNMRNKIEKAIEKIYRQDRVKVFLVGLAKHSKVLDRYRLAIDIENILPSGEPRYVSIPRDLEVKAYVWDEYAKGKEEEESGGEAAKFVAGDMYFVRFGKRSGDPIWIVDLFSQQKSADAEIFGYLLADAENGFPIPYYPLSLQRAHEYAQIVDLDYDILQHEVISAIRNLLPDDKKVVIDQQVFYKDQSLNRYA